MTTPGRRAVIAGVATSDYPHLPDLSEHGVHAQASLRALADAGLTLHEVDGLATAGFTPMYAVGLAEYLGLHPSYYDETNAGGASFEVLVEHAATAVEAGLAEVVLVSYGSVQLSAMGRTLGTGGSGGARGGRSPGPGIHDALWGNTLVGNYAMAAHRHMHQYGTTSEQLAAVAVTMRQHASHNPMAQYRERITVDDVLASRVVADPLHKLDCCVISDGGAACVITTEERARDLPGHPVYVLGGAHATTHQMNLSAMPDLTVTAAAQSGPLAFRRAGVTPEDIDVAQLYDSFTITVVLTVEDLGFCAKGEGGAFVDHGGLGVTGRLPTNTDGGGLSACHPGMRGMFLIVEAVRQLRGQGGATQVADARQAVVHGVGGMLSTGATLILSSEAP
jgi:acetyl-CoA acetyltransferase